MENKQIQVLKSVFLNGLELLFLYGLSVNLSAFMNGLSGGYVLLFTGMTISGSFILHEIWKRVFRVEDCADIYGILLSVTCLVINWKIGLVQIFVVAFLYLVRGIKWKDFLLVALQGAFVLLLNYEYMRKGVLNTQYIFLMFSEITYFEKDLKKKELCHFNVTSYRKKEFVLSVFLEMIGQSCLTFLFLCGVSSLIDITKIGALFRLEEMAVWIIGTCAVQMITKICLYRIKRNESEIILSQRFAFAICALFAGIALVRVSLLLGVVFVFVCMAFVAFESLMRILQKSCNVWVEQGLLLSVFVLSVQGLYDGVNVDIRTFLFVVFLMESFCVRYLSFTECRLESAEK